MQRQCLFRAKRRVSYALLLGLSVVISYKRGCGIVYCETCFQDFYVWHYQCNRRESGVHVVGGASSHVARLRHVVIVLCRGFFVFAVNQPLRCREDGVGRVDKLLIHFSGISRGNRNMEIQMTQETPFSA